MLIPRNVAPRGLPRWRSLACGEASEGRGDEGLLREEDNDVFRRKSCVIAMPMLAKEREVRSQARKVRSGKT
jgi:hypothetical protein